MNCAAGSRKAYSVALFHVVLREEANQAPHQRAVVPFSLAIEVLDAKQRDNRAPRQSLRLLSHYVICR